MQYLQHLAALNRLLAMFQFTEKPGADPTKRRSVGLGQAIDFALQPYGVSNVLSG